MNDSGSQQEAMHDLASLLWNRFLRERVLEELTHEVNAFRAEVVTNNGDGTLTVKRPFESNDLTLKAAASLGGAQPGDQVLILGIGDKRRALSNAFVLCKTDLSSFASEATVLAAFPTDTASGSPANFPDGADGVPVVDLSVEINPVQEGSGDPSPSNIRPISGWTGLTLYQSGADTSDPEELTISWASEAGTVYGGTLDVLTGLLTVTNYCGVLTGDEDFSLYTTSGYRRFLGKITSDTGWGWPEYLDGSTGLSSHFVYNASAGTNPQNFGIIRISNTDYLIFYDENAQFSNATAFRTWLAGQYSAGTPVQVCYQINTPVTYQLTPMQVRTLLGENNLWEDTGDVTVKYRADPTLYIQKKLGA